LVTETVPVMVLAPGLGQARVLELVLALVPVSARSRWQPSHRLRLTLLRD
jgi:hypothetical protein